MEVGSIAENQLFQFQAKKHFHEAVDTQELFEVHHHQK
jgi:hypothetical protein